MRTDTKTLIAYYSRAGMNYADGGVVSLPVGNTELAAKMIATLTGGAPFKIETVKSYPDGYDETTKVAKEELRQNARPELEGSVESIEDYDTIILGYPNWWSTMPMAVFTFLEAYDFSGKTILPFCTNEGSGMGRSEADIKRLCPFSTVQKGLAITGSGVREAGPAITAWLRANGAIE